MCCVAITVPKHSFFLSSYSVPPFFFLSSFLLLFQPSCFVHPCECVLISNGIFIDQKRREEREKETAHQLKEYYAILFFILMLHGHLYATLCPAALLSFLHPFLYFGILFFVVSSFRRKSCVLSSSQFLSLNIYIVV